MKGLLLVIGLILAIPLAIVVVAVGHAKGFSESLVKLVVFLIIIIPVAGLAGIKQKERAKLLQGFAESQGWAFKERASERHRSRCRYFDLLNRGSGIISNIMSVQLMWCETPTQGFCGDCGTGSRRGTSKNYTEFSFLIVEFPTKFAGDLLVRPEGLKDRLLSSIGFDDIDLESKRFSDEFFVRSSEKKFAYEVLSPRVMEFMMDTNLVGNAPSFEIAHGLLCVAGERRVWKPKEFLSALEWTQQLLDRLAEQPPASLWEKAR